MKVIKNQRVFHGKERIYLSEETFRWIDSARNEVFKDLLKVKDHCNGIAKDLDVYVVLGYQGKTTCTWLSTETGKRVSLTKHQEKILGL